MAEKQYEVLLDGVSKKDYNEAKSNKRLTLKITENDPKAAEFLDLVAEAKEQATAERRGMRYILVADDGTENRHMVRWVKNGNTYDLGYAEVDFTPAKSVEEAVAEVGADTVLTMYNQAKSTNTDDEKFKVEGSGRKVTSALGSSLLKALEAADAEGKATILATLERVLDPNEVLFIKSQAGIA